MYAKPSTNWNGFNIVVLDGVSESVVDVIEFADGNMATRQNEKGDDEYLVGFVSNPGAERSFTRSALRNHLLRLAAQSLLRNLDIPEE